jgi:predicted transcriptional regulator of viral defense system
MALQILHESGIVRVNRLEQAMAWMVGQGPLVENPKVPSWIVKSLVRTKRIARLRKGLYLVPDERGRMAPLPAVIKQLAPDGYLSFYGAFSASGLTDQDAPVWIVVSGHRQAPIRYGRRTVRFFTSRARARSAETRELELVGGRLRVATPAQALMDTLEYPTNGPSLSELVRVVGNALSARRLSKAALRRRVLARKSPSLARRLGFVIEVATGTRDSALAGTARRTHDWTDADGRGGLVRDNWWRLTLPESSERIRAAAG